MKEIRQPPDDVEIRQIALGDDGDLIRLWRDAWTNTYGASLGPDALGAMLTALDANGIALMLPGTGERGYCAVSDGNLIGTAIIAERGATVYGASTSSRIDSEAASARACSLRRQPA